MIETWLDHDAERGAEERGSQFRDNFLKRVSFIPEALAEFPIEAVGALLPNDKISWSRTE